MRFELKSEVKRRERFQASLEGNKTYYTGRPCKHGHVSSRRTDNGECVECIRNRRVM